MKNANIHKTNADLMSNTWTTRLARASVFTSRAIAKIAIIEIKTMQKIKVFLYQNRMINISSAHFSADKNARHYIILR